VPSSLHPAAGVDGETADAGLADKVSILIVDDREDKLLALETALEELGQNLVRAQSGKEALRCLLKQDFAVILLDVNMPIMDGFETAALIRQRARSELTPIIFISAVNDAGAHISRGYSLGAVDYMLSPIIPQILRAKVAVFVDLFRKTQQIQRQAEERIQFQFEQAARTEAEAAQERLAFLAEASNVLAASLDDEQTFQSLGRLIVPKMAAGCVIDLLEEDGSLRAAAVIHRNPAQRALLTALRARYPVDLEWPSSPARALSTGKTDVRNQFNAHDIAILSRDDDHRQLMSKLELSCYISVPLSARGRLIGVMSLIDVGPSNHCGPTEVWLAEELAQRAALALDNAALYKTAQAARREAERANLAKDRFLAMLSHELRTPLTPVLTSIHLLTADPSLPETAQASLQMIRRNVELEARLIDDLLDLTRVTKGKLQLNFDTVDAHVLLRNVVDICGDDIREKRLELCLDLQAKDFFLQADPARIQQVYWNLLKNAVKFTPAGGRVTLSTANDASGWLRVEVIDNGCGINAESLPRIFNAFEQDGLSGNEGGLGLGLAIAKSLVDMHQGKLTAESPGKDLGAKFTLSFPTVAVRERERRVIQPDKAAAAAEPAKERQPLRLLLVDDHEDTNRSLTLLLKRRGYKVQSATTVAAAVALARESEFDVLVSDMGLPDGNGVDLLRQMERPPTLGGIILSGFGMEEDIQRSKAAGFKEHLSKPVDINKLDGIIQQLAQRGHF
jgi:signal transduction histidine kinase/DNA-binding response OmpR family regulator